MKETIELDNITYIKTLEYKKYDSVIDIGEKVISDARSAAFYALGKIKVSRNMVLLYCRTEELASTLTAVTEAYYQSLPMLIISLGDKNENRKIARCFEPVTEKIIYENQFDYEKINLLRNEKKCRPIIWFIDYLNIQQDVDVECVEFIEKIAMEFENNMKDIYELFVPSADYSFKNEKVYLYRDTEGIIYEFLGMAAVEKEKKILVVFSNKIKQNINAFNLRYIGNNITIICLGREVADYKEWFVKNGFYYKETLSIDEMIKNSIEDKKQIIVWNV